MSLFVFMTLELLRVTWFLSLYYTLQVLLLVLGPQHSKGSIKILAFSIYLGLHCEILHRDLCDLFATCIARKFRSFLINQLLGSYD
jgi:hypothetical protein